MPVSSGIPHSAADALRVAASSIAALTLHQAGPLSGATEAAKYRQPSATACDESEHEDAKGGLISRSISARAGSEGAQRELTGLLQLLNAEKST